RQLAVFASWLLAGGNPQTAKRRRCTTLYLVWTHNLVERRDTKRVTLLNSLRRLRQAPLFSEREHLVFHLKTQYPLS
ncbi:hypothetical protein, partial [Sporosarcina aquimarina]|uniref:hypothetical protein n=1 Tax=Sporosarcina aquimarina TaxID=114975 RepID=UPI001C8EAED7